VPTASKVNVVARSRGKLLFAWLMCFWRAVLALAFVIWIIVTGAGILVLDGKVRPDLVRPIANAVGAPLAVLACAGLVRLSVSQLLGAHLCIDGAEVTFRGYVAWKGVVERRYQLNELVSVTLGQPPNTVERLLIRINAAAGFSIFFKEGLLVVTDVYGEQVTFPYMNIAFDLAQVQAFVAELSYRGVGGGHQTEPLLRPTDLNKNQLPGTG
jgi:hypothetical protein